MLLRLVAVAVWCQVVAAVALCQGAVAAAWCQAQARWLMLAVAVARPWRTCVPDLRVASLRELPVLR